MNERLFFSSSTRDRFPTRSAAAHVHETGRHSRPGTWRRGPALAACIAGAMIGGCTTAPSIQSGDDADTIMEGRLARVDNARSELAYVDPDADYSRYESVWLTPLDVDNVEIIQPGGHSSVGSRYNREWELTDQDKEKLQEAYRAAMERSLTDGGAFALASAGGDDVLRVDAIVTRLAPSAPRDDARSRGTRSTVITEGAGSMSISMVLSDGDSGEILAIIKDTRSSSSANSWSINNSVSNMAEVRRLFNTWGARLQDGLLALRDRMGSL